VALIAEAFVRVRPDLTGFRAEVERQLRTAVAGVRAPTVPIQAARVGAAVDVRDVETGATRGAAAQATAAAAADRLTTATNRQTEAKRTANAEERRRITALELEAAAASRLGIAEQQAAAGVLRLAEVEQQATAATSARRAAQAAATAAARTADQALIQSTQKILDRTQAREASSRRLLSAVRAQATAEQRLSLIQQSGAAATTQIQSAQRQLSASKAAVVSASRSETLALETENVALQQNAALTTRSAIASEAQAAASLQQARGAQTTSNRISQAARGAGAAALAFTGLRGATLAATGSFLAGAAALTAIGRAIGQAASFEQQLSVFRVTAQATAEEMEKVSSTARQLGADVTLPGVSAVDAAEALTNLSRAGLSVRDSIEGTRGVLQLATAAEIDNAAATELAAGALNAFGLGGDQAVHVADVFANAAISAQGNIADFGIALQQTAAVSSQFGVSLEDTLSLLTILAQNALRGSDAGTSLRTALLRLAAPTREAQRALDGLGLEIRDAQGNIRPEVFGELGDAIERLQPAAQARVLSRIFGQDAIRAAGLLAREGVEGLQQVQQQLDRQGTAAEVAGARTEGLAGAASGLVSNLDTLGTNLGDLVQGPLTDYVTGLSDIIGGINSAVDAGRRLTSSSDETKRSFAELAAEAGRFNVAVSARGAQAGQGLLERQRELNKELEAALPAALVAKSGLESYRSTLILTTDAAQGLINRMDESEQRFTTPQATGLAPTGLFLAPSERLNIAEIEAQETESLQDNLRLAKLREQRLQKQADTFRGSRARFAELREELARASLAVDQVEDSIRQQQEQAGERAKQRRERQQRDEERLGREAEQRRRQALGLTEERLSFQFEQAQRREAIQLIRRRGSALVAFFREQSRSDENTAREREGFRQQAIQAAQETAKVIREVRQHRLDEAQEFALQRIETRKLQAQLTSTNRDDIAATQAEIRIWQRAIRNTQLRGRERKLFIEEARQNIIRGKLEIQQLRGDQQKARLDLSQFFREAQDVIERFGPDIQLGGGGQFAGLFPVPTGGGIATGAGGGGVATAARGGVADPALAEAIRQNTQALEGVRAGIGTTVHVNQTWTGEPVPNRLDAHRRARFGYLAEFD
jgi:TP901 family phage tail tape measure protein